MTHTGESSSSNKEGPTKGMPAIDEGMYTTITSVNSLPFIPQTTGALYGEAIQERCENSTYFVNFPEGEDSDGKSSNPVSGERESVDLANLFTQSLHVKRKRHDSSLLLLCYNEDILEYEDATGYKRRKIRPNSGDVRMKDTQTMAEEAGQIMPHPQP